MHYEIYFVGTQQPIKVEVDSAAPEGVTAIAAEFRKPGAQDTLIPIVDGEDPLGHNLWINVRNITFMRLVR